METTLIVWNETPMMNKLCFELLGRRDIMRVKNEDNSQKSFGGKIFILG